MTTTIALAYRKYVLCQIYANCRNIHLDFPFLHFRLINEIKSWHIDAGGYGGSDGGMQFCA